MVAEWFRATAITSREEGDVGPSKIPFPDEIFLNNSRVYSSSNLMHSSLDLIAHSVAFRFAKFMEVVEAMEVVSD